MSVSDRFKYWEFYQKLETMNAEVTFEEYVEQFKAMLVKRYNWSVTKASEYNSPALDETYKEGLSVRDAYFKIFNVEQDLCSSL